MVLYTWSTRTLNGGEVGFNSVYLEEVPSELDRPARSLLQGNRVRLLYLPFTPSLRGVVGRALSSILNLDILLGASEVSLILVTFCFTKYL